MINIKQCLKSWLPKGILISLVNSTKIQRFRYWFAFKTTLSATLHRQLSNQEKAVDTTRAPGHCRVLLPLIETSHYQYTQLILLAKALETRGAQIRVLICGQCLDGCEIKSVRNEHDGNPCWKCHFNEVNLLPLFGLETIKLSAILTKQEIATFGEEAKHLVCIGKREIIRHGVNLEQSIDDSVVRYFYGAVPDDSERVRIVREAHTRTALMSIEIANRLDRDWSPQVVLSNMTCYSAWEAYFRYFNANGNRFCQISMSQFDFKSIVFNSFELFPASDRFANYLNSRNNKKLVKKERLELTEFIHQRRSGKAEIFVHDKYFSEVPHSDEIMQKLGFDESKRNIFLFANLYWDVGLSDRSGLFDGVLDWVIQTIETLRQEPNCHLYVKPHPAEVFGSAGSLKGVSKIIKETYPDGLSNLTIIEPEWKLKTYDLFPYIDVGVIFTGTIGLEMMLAGIPVISTGMTSHNGLGFAIEPDTLVSYRQALIGEKTPPEINQNQLELFAYFYFIRTLLPWTLTKQSYADDFDGFLIDSLEDLKPGHDPYLDHLCKIILDPQKTIPEAWPDEVEVNPASPLEQV